MGPIVNYTRKWTRAGETESLKTEEGLHMMGIPRLSTVISTLSHFLSYILHKPGGFYTDLEK